MKLAPTFPDWLFVCFLSTWHWNAANRHTWYGLYYETRNYFNCPSNSLPRCCKQNDFLQQQPDSCGGWQRSCSLGSGLLKGSLGAAASPLTWTMGVQPAQDAAGAGTDLFASSCPHPAQSAQTLLLSFATAFIYKNFNALCVEIILG